MHAALLGTCDIVRACVIVRACMLAHITVVGVHCRQALLAQREELGKKRLQTEMKEREVRMKLREQINVRPTVQYPIRRRAHHVYNMYKEFASH